MNEAVITKVEADIDPPKESKDGIVSTQYRLNVREEPSTNGSILATLDPHNKILVEEIKGSWCLIYTSFGVKGYVMSKYIRIGGDNG
jgi:SH3-like domain-containing protein